MNTIEKLQYNLNQWYEASSIGHYLCLWKVGLKSFVPEKYHSVLFPQAIQVYLTQDDQQVVVWCKKAKTFERCTDAVDEHGEKQQWWHQVTHIINKADGKKVLVRYLVSKNDALVRKVAMPAAAKENLEEVIGFELDKYVPFKAEQVQLSYKIDKKKSNDSKLLMDLVVLPIQKVTDVVNLCDEKSIALDGIDVNQMNRDGSPDSIGVNLLPQEKRKPKDYSRLQINAILSVALMAMIYFVMHTSLANKQDKIEQLTQVNAELQEQARRAKLLRKELKEVIVSSRFLQTKKQKHPSMVGLFSEVTSIMPEHTYLTRLKLDHEKLEVSGQSNNASNLVPLMDQSEQWYLPEIIGNIRPDPRTNKEKFTIKALLQEPQPEKVNDTKS